MNWSNDMQHKDLASNRWFKLSLVEQMANIGSEVFRALKWKANLNPEYSSLANIRALELFDLTLNDKRHKNRLKEIARARELWLDFLIGNNQYNQTSEQWQNYFLGFNNAARIKT